MEYKKRCRTCGRIFCFTDADVSENNKNATIATISAIAGLANAIGGNRFDMYEQSKISDRASNSITDYNKCPYCGSEDVYLLDDDEIKRLEKAEKARSVNISGGGDPAALLKRAALFLEDGEWAMADAYAENALNGDPENPFGYLYKLMAEKEVSTVDGLAGLPEAFSGDPLYKKAIRFADPDLKEKLEKVNKTITDRNLLSIYEQAVSDMNKAESELEYLEAAEKFKNLNIKDSETMLFKCLENAEICRKDDVYDLGISQMSGNSISGYEAAINAFSTIPGWKNADELIIESKQKIEAIRAKGEAAAIKRKKMIKIAALIVAACIALVVLLTTVIMPKQKLNKAMALLDSGDYEAAYALLEELGKNDVIASNKYDRAVALLDSGDYEAAYAFLEELGKNDEILSNKYDRARALLDSGDYEKAYALLEELGKNDEIVSNKYDRAVALLDSGDLIRAYELLNGLDHKDSSDKATECLYLIQKPGLSNVSVRSIIKFGSYEQDADTTNGKEEIEWIVLAVDGSRALLISRYALDGKQFNEVQTNNTTWENCTLRTWLNDTFYNTAFGKKHQEMIQSVTVTADKNPSYSANPGNDTTDKIFLLSISEANKYFSSDNARRCRVTLYGCTQYVNNSNYWTRWWLRSPGWNSQHAANVTYDGSVSELGDDVDYRTIAVRPALWIVIEQ